MKSWVIEIDDEEGGTDRKIYLTSWGVSVWKDYAKSFEEAEAEKTLLEYLKNNDDRIGRVIKL